MKKLVMILMTVTAVMMFSGCDSSDTTYKDANFTSSIATTYGEVSGFGGFAELNLVTEYSKDIDPKSFVVTGGIRPSVPTVTDNGSLLFAWSIEPIRANTTTSPIQHILEMSYLKKGKTSLVRYVVTQQTKEASEKGIGDKAVEEYVYLNVDTTE